MLFRLTFLLVLIVHLPLKAQPSLFSRMLEQGDTLILRVDTDWRNLLADKTAKEYQPMTLTFSLGEAQYAFPGKIRTRGNIRLQVCSNPSLKIKLKKKAIAAAGFGPNNKLKIVEQCSNSRLGVGYLRRERLVYDLHQIYSDHFHRTVPIILRAEGRKDVHSFIVESEEELSSRYGKVLEQTRISKKGLNRAAYVNMCLFNYLILNTDFNVFNRHNIEMVTDSVSGSIIPIPYDFDYSGFVGTSYAVPREELDIPSVYAPKWLGLEVTPEELLAGARHYLDRAASAQKLIESYPNLAKSDRKRMLKRLNAFNQLLDDEKRLLRLLR